MNQRAIGVLDGLRFLTANLAIREVFARGWAVWTGTLSLGGGEEDRGEMQCGKNGLQASSDVLGKVLASDAHSPGLEGSVFRLLGGEKVHVGLRSCCRCSLWTRESPPWRGRHRRQSTAVGGALPAGLDPVLWDVGSGCDVNIGFHFTVQRVLHVVIFCYFLL